MKKTLTTLLMLSAVISPIFARAETITISDPLIGSIQEMQAKIADIRSEITKYRAGGLTPANKLLLINRITDIKKDATTLKAKIIAYQNAPVVAAKPVDLLNPKTPTTPATITIPGTNTVITPTGTFAVGTLPATMYVGDTYTLPWKSTGYDNIGITLRGVPETSASILPIVVSTPASLGGYAWTVPSTVVNGDYSFQFYNSKNSSEQWRSPTVRIIQKPLATQTVNLFTPNGGAYQYFTAGQPVTIEWSTTGLSSTLTLNITNADNSRQTSIGSHANPIASKNTFTWNIPSDFVPGKYKVVLIETHTGKILDQSDSYFDIVAPNTDEAIYSVYPTSGPVGTEVTITGNKFSTSGNDVMFTISGGTILQRLSSTDTKTMKFVIPTNYKISGVGQFEVDGSNLVPFTVTTPQGYLDFQLGSSNLSAGNTYNFVWNGPTLKDVTLKLSKNGSVATQLTYSTMTNGSVYSWNIPSSMSGTYTLTATTGANDISVANSAITVNGTASPSPTPSSSTATQTTTTTSSAPTLNSYTPSSAMAGSKVTLSGTGFTSSSVVYFNAKAVTTTYVNDTSVSFVIPTGTTAGSYKIYVSNSGLTSSSLSYTVSGPSSSGSVSVISADAQTASVLDMIHSYFDNIAKH